MKTNRLKTIGVKAALGFVITAGALLASNCAYTETMNQRNAEGQYLQEQLSAEQARGSRLSSQTP